MTPVTDQYILDQLNAQNDSGPVTDQAILSQLNGADVTNNQPSGPPLTRTGKFLRGAMDPLDAGAQMISNALPTGAVSAVNEFNNWLADKTGMVARVPEGGVNQMVADKEKSYQSSRVAAGESGIDAYRLAGNVASTIPLALSSPVAATLRGRVAVGAATGGAFGAAQPVTENQDQFWTEKAKQAGVGAAFGGAAPVVLSGAARLISPKASINPELQALRAEGVKPTIGQALGGKMAVAEEKLQSLPIVGDMINRARGQTLDTFNKASINRALKPIGASVDDIGQEGVKKAGDLLSQSYDDALSQVKNVKFDAKFDVELMQLKSMASNLVPDMQKKFNKTLNDIVSGRMGPQRSMLGDVYKSVDSELGKQASRFGKSTAASEQELGDALSQLQNLLKQQMMRSNPQIAKELQASNSGWAQLVRIEQAAKAAHNNGGVFTPAQLNAAIRSSDDSVRGRAVSRGTALMQDFGSSAQKVLGSKYPDSGTAGRLALGTGAIGAGFINPAIPAGLVAGGSLYTRPVQNALVSMLADRPQSAVSLAKMVRQLSPYGSALAAPFGNAFANP